MAFIQEISFDSLVGYDDSPGSQWQKDIGRKIQVEGVVREMLEKVVEDGERLPVARVLFAEHEEEELSDIELSDGEDNLWTDTHEDTLRRCEVCSQNELTIWERIRVGEKGEPVDRLREHEGRLMCGCCQDMLESPLSEFKFCCSCFVSEKMGRRYGISMIPVENSQDENVCSVCNDIYPEIALGEVGEYEEESVWEQLLDGTWVLEDGGEEDVYEGEYENEDPPENNTEIAKEIKGSISEIGEQLFDIQEKLTEGEYLKLMDLLQKVTNNVNRL